MPTGRIQVAPGQTIVSAGWGNPLWDHSVQCFASAADRANQFPNPQPGAMSFTEDTKTLWVYVNGAWTQIGMGATASGNLQVPITAGAGFSAPVAVTFPAGRFSAPPNGVASCYSNSYFAFVYPPTTSGFQVAIRLYTGTAGANTNIQVFWTAIQAS
jgi:hypothetical protein